jgi:hypothetical protein
VIWFSVLGKWCLVSLLAMWRKENIIGWKRESLIVAAKANVCTTA